jgi:hypothetical protein
LRRRLEIIEVIVIVGRGGIKHVEAIAATHGLLSSGNRGRWRRCGRGRIVIKEVDQVGFGCLWCLRLLRGLSTGRRAGCLSSGRGGICLIVLIVFIKSVGATPGILEFASATSKTTAVTVDSSAISTEGQTITAKPSIAVS